MIDSLSTVGPSISQQRTSVSGGVSRINRISEDEKSSSPNQFDQQQSQPLDEKKKEKVKAIVNGLNEFLKPDHTSIKFKLHEKLNEYYVTIVDDNTNEVVKEIPAKKLLDTYALMAEQLGFLVDKKI